MNRKPLTGKRILITRAREQARDLVRRLERLGAEPVIFPMIRIEDISNGAVFDRAVRRLDGYDILLFSSVNGADRFFVRLARPEERRRLRGKEIWAIGPSTARRVRRYGARVSLVPQEFSSEGLARTLRRRTVRGKKILYPRANIGSDVALREIRRRGGTVTVLPVYRITPVKARSMGALNGVDVLTFASAQTVRNFAESTRKQKLELLLKRAKIACIGPVTAQEVRRQGWQVGAVARRYTIPGLVEAVVKLCIERVD